MVGERWLVSRLVNWVVNALVGASLCGVVE